MSEYLQLSLKIVICTLLMGLVLDNLLYYQSVDRKIIRVTFAQEDVSSLCLLSNTETGHDPIYNCIPLRIISKLCITKLRNR